jgi:hypothetical protein
VNCNQQLCIELRSVINIHCEREPANLLQYYSDELHSVMNHGTKFCRLCLKPLLSTILTSSLPFYPYQMDERALPGYLRTRCFFSPVDILVKRFSLSPRCFLFTSALLISFLTLCLSLFSAQRAKRSSVLSGYVVVSEYYRNSNITFNALWLPISYQNRLPVIVITYMKFLSFGKPKLTNLFIHLFTLFHSFTTLHE